MRYAKIVSTGRYVPEIEISNDTLRKRFAHLPDFVDKMEESSNILTCLLYTSPSPRDRQKSRMPSSA